MAEGVGAVQGTDLVVAQLTVLNETAVVQGKMRSPHGAWTNEEKKKNLTIASNMNLPPDSKSGFIFWAEMIISA